MGERQPLLSVVRYYIRSQIMPVFSTSQPTLHLPGRCLGALSTKLGLVEYFSRALQRRGEVKTHLLVDITA